MGSQIVRLTDQNLSLQQKVDTQMTDIQNLVECKTQLENRNQQLEANLKDAVNCKIELQTKNQKLSKESVEFCAKISSLSGKILVFY